MITSKKAKVIMLPTNKPSKLGNLATYQGHSLAKVIKEGVKPINTILQFWNLYIISDDKIEEDDYYIIDGIPELLKNNGLKFIDDYCKKVIATTDETLYLTFNNGKTDLKFVLPKPSDSFISKYIEEYNKGNVITDVLVEYELVSNEEYFLNTINPDDDVPYFDENLKINPDNTITIKKVKDSYSREEVIEFGNKVKEYCKDGWKPDSLHRVFFEWDKWIEENL